MLTPQQRMTSVPNLLPPLNPIVEQKWRQALQLFTTDAGQTHGDVFTCTQVQIIDIIAKRRFPRTQLILPTQYGKSYCVADGVLLRASTHKEKWAIISSTEDKARIIMDYIIDGIFADPMLLNKLEYSGSKETLKKERSKTRITFRGGGEIRVYSGNASNTKAVKTALMGFGAPNIILDESGAISDELYSTVKRMVGGSEGTISGTFLLEIGNPVFRNHFYRTWFGERYMKIYVNDQTALAQGRFTVDFLEEMKEEVGYDWMYACMFPDATEVLASGYRRLINDQYVDNSYIDAMPELTYKTNPETGERLKNSMGFDIIDDNALLGIDVSGSGANETRLIIRLPRHSIAFVAKVMKGNISDEDLDEVADAAIELADKWNIGDYRIIYDMGGVGYGMGAIFRQKGRLAKGIMFGESRDHKTGERKIPKTFLNYRAYMYWESRKWVRSGEAKLLRDDGFEELKLIYYKRNNTDKTQIEPKEEMIKRYAADGIKVTSPDTADGLVLTFADTSSIVEEDDIELI
jgi:hypothetical protein